jgi:transmembrane sensor
MKKSEFEQLIEKYRQGLLTGREKELMDAWFESLGRDEELPLRTEAEREVLKRRVMAGLDRQAWREPVAGPVRKLWPARVWKIAASVLLVAAVSLAVWQYAARYMEAAPRIFVASAAAGAVHKVLLDDGSLVWLKNNSSLTYPSAFTGPQRHVTLQGEALFEVAKDATHPFIIECGGLTTTVLGTSFNIKTTEHDIEVVVLTGKVSLTSRTDSTGIVVMPSEKAVYRREMKQLAKVETQPQETVLSMAGTEYDMNFHQTRLSEAIRRIELKFEVRIALADATMNNCMITADFTDQSLTRTLDVVTATLSATYEVDGRNIRLNGTGCSE